MDATRRYSKDIHQQMKDLMCQLEKVEKESGDADKRCFGISKGRVVYGMKDSLKPEDQREMIELMSNVLGEDFHRSNEKTVNQWHVDLFIKKISSVKQTPYGVSQSDSLSSSKCLSDGSASLGGAEDLFLEGVPANDGLCQYIVDLECDKKQNYLFDFHAYFIKRQVGYLYRAHVFGQINQLQWRFLRKNREEYIEFFKFFYNYLQASKKCAKNHEFKFKITSEESKQEEWWGILYNAFERRFPELIPFDASEFLYSNHEKFQGYQGLGKVSEYEYQPKPKPKCGSEFEREKKCLAAFMYKFLEREDYWFLIERAQEIAWKDYALVLQDSECDIASVSEEIEAQLSAWIRNKQEVEEKSSQAAGESDAFDDVLKSEADDSDSRSECHFEYESEDEYGDSDYEDK